MGRVQHRCVPGDTLEHFDARVYHQPQQAEMTSAPHQTVIMFFPYTAFTTNASPTRSRQSQTANHLASFFAHASGGFAVIASPDRPWDLPPE